jgi:hypothetical protein
VAPFGAQSHLDPDFPSSLTNRNVHDVGDSDSRHQQGHSPHHTEKGLDANQDESNLPALLDGVPEEERPLVPGIEAVSGRKRFPDFPLDELVLRGLGRLVGDSIDVFRPAHDAKGGKRNDHLVHVRAVVHAHLELVDHHAHDQEGHVVDVDRLSHRLLAGHELLGDSRADESDPAIVGVELASEPGSQL